MPRDKEESRVKRRPAFYWWTLANALALCAAILSWLLFLHVFGHPEIPRNYELIRKLGRAEAPKPLTELQAPPGEAADPRALWIRYAGHNETTLSRINAALMRNYLTNLKEQKLIQYAEGEYRVEAVRRLTEDDLFHPGFAVRGRAMLPPDEFSEPAPWPVVIDYLFPTPNAEAADWILPGDQLSVSKFPNCAMVLHVARIEEEDTPLVNLTLVPVVFGDFLVGEGRKFKLEAPTELNPAAPFPVFPSSGEP